MRHFYSVVYRAAIVCAPYLDWNAKIRRQASLNRFDDVERERIRSVFGYAPDHADTKPPRELIDDAKRMWEAVGEQATQLAGTLAGIHYSAGGNDITLLQRTAADLNRLTELASKLTSLDGGGLLIAEEDRHAAKLSVPFTTELTLYWWWAYLPKYLANWPEVYKNRGHYSGQYKDQWALAKRWMAHSGEPRNFKSYIQGTKKKWRDYAKNASANLGAKSGTPCIESALQTPVTDILLLEMPSWVRDELPLKRQEG